MNQQDFIIFYTSFPNWLIKQNKKKWIFTEMKNSTLKSESDFRPASLTGSNAVIFTIF